jgi:hypothetical protein
MPFKKGPPFLSFHVKRNISPTIPTKNTPSIMHNPLHSWMHPYKTMKCRKHGKLVSTTLVVNMLGASLAQLIKGVCMLETYSNAINFSMNMHITKQVGTLLEI